MRLTFGKYKNKDLADVPDSYLKWGARNLSSRKWQEIFNQEITRRQQQSQKGIKLWKKEIDSVETFLSIKSEIIANINNEIDNSGCEWEYYSMNIEKEADELAHQKILELKQEIKRDNVLTNATNWAIDQGVTESKSIDKLINAISTYEIFNVLDPINKDVRRFFQEYLQKLDTALWIDFRPAIAQISQPTNYCKIVEFAREYYQL
jgi:hypothetical protein